MEDTCDQNAQADLWVVGQYDKRPPSNWIRSVIQKLTARNIKFRLVSLRTFVLGIENSKTVLFMDGERCEEKNLPKVAYIVMPTSFASITFLTAIKHLESVGVRCVNSHKAFSITTNKYEQIRTLLPVGVKIPDTLSYPTYIKDGMTNMLQVPNLIHFPAILKNVHGNSGKRVMLLKDRQIAEDLAENLFDDGMYLLQQYISECRAIHYRVMVVDGQVRGFFKYNNTASSRVQSNLSQGGSREELLDPSRDLEEMSVRIAKAFEADIVGIDYLKDKDGNFVFMEANGSAGVANHEGIVDSIIDFLLKCCQS